MCLLYSFSAMFNTNKTLEQKVKASMATPLHSAFIWHSIFIRPSEPHIALYIVRIHIHIQSCAEWMEQHGTSSCLYDHDIEAYTDTVMRFIRKCSTDKNKALSARTSAFKSGNTDDRNQASYDLRKSKAAKRQYKNKVEEQFNTNNTRGMWQGINNITGFKGNKPATLNITASLPDKLKEKQTRWVHSSFPSRM